MFWLDFIVKSVKKSRNLSFVELKALINNNIYYKRFWITSASFMHIRKCR